MGGKEQRKWETRKDGESKGRKKERTDVTNVGRKKMEGGDRKKKFEK